MPAKKLLWLLPLLVLSACSEAGLEAEISHDGTAASGVAVDTVADVSYAADVANKDRKLIRTADIECQVANVLAAVTKLEGNVIAAGGTIENSNIGNNAEYPQTVTYKADSIKRVQVCHTTATLTLRVPVHMLDTVVNSIPGSESNITTRRLAQQDVTYKYMTNALLNKPGELASTKKALLLAEDSRDAIDVQRYADTRKEQFVNRHVENLRMLENVAFSTITVKFTQPETVLVQTVVNTEYMTKPTFRAEMGMALHNSTRILEGLLIVLVSIWPLLLIIVAVVAVVVYARRRRNAAIRRFDSSVIQ